MKRVFSGVQPTGQIHLGNFITMQNFVKIQDTHDCFYCIVDMHSITVPQDPKELHKHSLELAALYVALGIDPKKSTLFIQSHVPAHAELAWLLQCNTTMGELNRMTQFKDKSAGKKVFSTGLFTYPVLMAADILLYDTNAVPVGNDQKQHLELTRDVAERFNNKYGETFIIPEPMISKVGARIMSLDDPSKKMSKSNSNVHSKISILDPPNKIKKSIMKATTDSDGIVKFDEENKPGISNLLTIYSVLSDYSIADLELKYQDIGYGDFKKDLVEVVQNKLAPIQARYNEILESGEILDILKEGANKAEKIAIPVINRTKNALGFVPR